MVLSMVVFWALVVAGIVVVAKAMGGPGRPTSNLDDGSSAMRILEERFARGEIDREEFEDRRNALTR